MTRSELKEFALVNIDAFDKFFEKGEKEGKDMEEMMVENGVQNILRRSRGNGEEMT